MAPARVTRNAAVFSRLRADILTGRFEPGQRLRFAELCAEYDASVGVVREGLSRLAEQGLVRAEPQQGFRVAPVSVQDLLDLTATRRDIEGLTIRYAVEHGDLAWESAVVAALHVLIKTPKRIESPHGATFNEEWSRAHANFHATVLSGCPSPRLIGIATSLRDAAELYWRSSRRPVGHGPARDTDAEHQAIAEAVLARDVDRAVDLLMAHIKATTESLLETDANLTRSDTDNLALTPPVPLTPPAPIPAE